MVWGAAARVGSDRKQLVKSVPVEECPTPNKRERHSILFIVGRLTLWQGFCSKYFKKLGQSLLVQVPEDTPSEGLDTVDNTPGTSV